ncbi:MAG: type II toxin-antitoxin system VapC family toxin [Acidobacteria bacterium]|nr:type II toxin-antitoxin system VapC family toxin [Acidobacteriota bacterium]
MLLDSDVMIWAFRSEPAAVLELARDEKPMMSVVTLMEVMQGVGSAAEQRATRTFITSFGIEIVPLSAAIGDRAAKLIDQYAMGHGLRALDALIAATALELDLPLISGNRKHFASIAKLNYRHFVPHHRGRG